MTCPGTLWQIMTGNPFTECPGTRSVCDHFLHMCTHKKTANWAQWRVYQPFPDTLLAETQWQHMRSREMEEGPTPPVIDGLSSIRRVFYMMMPYCLKHAGLKHQLVSCRYRTSSWYVGSILATSIQDYRTIELLFKASSSSGLEANASLAS